MIINIIMLWRNVYNIIHSIRGDPRRRRRRRRRI